MILDQGYVHGGDIYSRPIRLDFSANVNPFGAPEAVFPVPTVLVRIGIGSAPPQSSVMPTA